MRRPERRRFLRTLTASFSNFEDDYYDKNVKKDDKVYYDSQNCLDTRKSSSSTSPAAAVSTEVSVEVGDSDLRRSFDYAMRSALTIFNKNCDSGDVCDVVCDVGADLDSSVSAVSAVSPVCPIIIPSVAFSVASSVAPVLTGDEEVRIPVEVRALATENANSSQSWESSRQQKSSSNDTDKSKKNEEGSRSSLLSISLLEEIDCVRGEMFQLGRKSASSVLRCDDDSWRVMFPDGKVGVLSPASLQRGCVIDFGKCIGFIDDKVSSVKSCEASSDLFYFISLGNRWLAIQHSANDNLTLQLFPLEDFFTAAPSSSSSSSQYSSAELTSDLTSVLTSELTRPDEGSVEPLGCL